MTARSRLSSQAPSQRGAVLVTSLLLLLVLTIIGITTMQMSRMQERMAGNSRDLNLAFQGAESAARSGEAFIRAQTVRPNACSEAPCAVWLPGTAGGSGRVEIQDTKWWDDNGTADQHLPDLYRDPTFVVEEIGFVRTDGGVVLGEQDGRDFYQVSGRSTGGSDLAETVIQTTFTRKF
jgi:type IV pilus assembly protein PilX